MKPADCCSALFFTAQAYFGNQRRAGKRANLEAVGGIMRVRLFFTTSLILAVLAIGVHLSALGQFSRSVQAIAHAATLTEPAKGAASADTESFIRRGSEFLYIGYALAVGSAACVIASARRREPARRPLTIGLLMFYAVLQFLLV